MEDLKEKKQKLVDEFNSNRQGLAQLEQRQQQIIGQIQLIEELEAEIKEIKVEE